MNKEVNEKRVKEIIEIMRNIPEHSKEDFVPSPQTEKNVADLSAELGTLLESDEPRILSIAKDLSETAKNRWIKLGMDEIIFEAKTLEEICEK